MEPNVFYVFGRRFGKSIVMRGLIDLRDGPGPAVGSYVEGGEFVEGSDSAPSDPRARALWAKRNAGRGPSPEPIGKRSRNNKYLAKG